MQPKLEKVLKTIADKTSLNFDPVLGLLYSSDEIERIFSSETESIIPLFGETYDL
ncbi:hypothetical protein [Algoriphagus antarcticus]|uniref:Uncharacterized protein n=1 Tax=Algoriphagus antarcticus TaxID=238540 RepID=A0A3E0DWF1_9BACT|nr:hypothetical protein [Algoriphagus antarcticus]REG88313.1 hypothetical protein C8N25_11091 [Algoriphagus antarcticus]